MITAVIFAVLGAMAVWLLVEVVRFAATIRELERVADDTDER
jgi:hypothetical protein